MLIKQRDEAKYGLIQKEKIIESLKSENRFEKRKNGE